MKILFTLAILLATFGAGTTAQTPKQSALTDSWSRCEFTDIKEHPNVNVPMARCVADDESKFTIIFSEAMWNEFLLAEDAGDVFFIRVDRCGRRFTHTPKQRSQYLADAAASRPANVSCK